MHKDADGRCSAYLYKIAKGINEKPAAPHRFGEMTLKTKLMFDMNPWWSRIWNKLDIAQKIALQNLRVIDHHPQTERPVYILRKYNIPTTAGVLLDNFSEIPKDQLWIGTIGTAGDRFEDWARGIWPEKIYRTLWKYYPELKPGQAEIYYPKSARKFVNQEGRYITDTSTGFKLDLAQYISSMLNAEYRTEFFKGVHSIDGKLGFWIPKIGEKGLRNAGDPISFIYSQEGDKLYEMKSIVNKAANYVLGGDVIRTITGYQKNFDDPVVASRHILFIRGYAVAIFRSELDIGSLVATRGEEMFGRTTIALNKHPVMGYMHCSIRGKYTPHVVDTLRESGFSGGGHSEAAGMLILDDPEGENYQRFIDTLKRL